MSRRKNRTPTTSSEELIELAGRHPSDELLTFIGISRRTWNRWIKDGLAPVPLSILRLLRFRRRADLGEILGREWQGFEVRGRALMLPGARYPVMANELCGIWFRLQQIDSQGHQINQLKKEIERREDEIRELEKKAHFYREQLRLESRMGLMLATLIDHDDGHKI